MNSNYNIKDIEICDNNFSSETINNVFKKYGIILLRQILPIKEIENFCDLINLLLDSRLRDLSIVTAAEASIDDKLNLLCSVDRNHGANLFDVLRETVNFQQFISQPSLIEIIKILIESEYVHVPFQHAALRIDRPNERWYEFQWHQDYPFNLLSHPSVTVWTPLTVITENMGPLKFILSSHTSLQKVDIFRRRNEKGELRESRHTRIFDLDESTLEESAISVTMSPGDILLFHEFLIHRSGHNVSQKSRWTIQARYGNLLDTNMVSRGWKNRRSNGFELFCELHSDSVAQKD